jgi:hypothetical protein
MMKFNKGVQTTMMNLDFENDEIADELIRAIEKDYGRGIARIPYFERVDFCTFEIKIIFTDFKLLEGIVQVVPFHGFGATVKVDGIYY